MTTTEHRISTGIDGLDEVLGGGYIPGCSYMIEGPPGSGKSLLGLQYLIDGVANGEQVLYINLEETVEDITNRTASAGMDVSGIDFLDLTPKSTVFSESKAYDIFSVSEVEQEAIVSEITSTIDSTQPTRVFVDPITRFRHITPNEFHFREQILAFSQYIEEQGATLVFTTQTTASSSNEDLEFISDGSIKIGVTEMGRRISVPKFRGGGPRSGLHVFKITDDGLAVFPDLNPDVFARDFESEQLSSGVPELDELLHGGIERGTCTIISGPTGVGKTTLGTQFIKEGAGRGERSVLYLFEESKRTFLKRTRGINIPVEQMQQRDTLEIVEIEPSAITPHEFSQMVRDQVENNGASLIMIDGLAGYQLSIMGDEMDLVRRIHKLIRYLKNMGVTSILVEELDTVTGDFVATNDNTSYLADNLLFLRHTELDGRLEKTIGMLKKRTSNYGRNLHTFEITEHGLKVGRPMRGVVGILEGTPQISETPDE